MRITLIFIFCLMATITSAQLQPVASGAFHWADMPVKRELSRESRSIMNGTSPHFEYLEIHATTQKKGAKPKPLKANNDTEEVIIVKEGLMKITVDSTTRTIGPGGVVLLLPKTMHALENIGDGDLTYFVMGYRSKKPVDMERALASGPSFILNADSLELKASKRGAGRHYFNRPTAMCENFEMHVTRLNNKGPSHEPHTHIDTEIILVISGNTEMTIDGKEYKAKEGDLYFMESNLLHGVRNATDQPCMYFAFKWR